MIDCLPYLQPSDFPTIERGSTEILQVNLGYLCNLSCTHCHVNAGPKRSELMERSNIDQVLNFLNQNSQIHTLDLTGGAPEMNPNFRYLIKQASQLPLKIIDRCNLVILQEPEYHDLGEFLAAQQVEIVASLPCYLEDNVDKQRGKGVFEASIKALQQLNALGYGHTDSPLMLHLVFNPQGPSLPPEQSELEKSYKAYLYDHYGIVFNQLLALTNLPIKRFGSQLISRGEFDDYLQLLKTNHQTANLESVMCKNTLSVDWQGYLYDCDFNQMLDLPLSGRKTHITQADDIANHQSIKTLQHCYGCTAGQGSSCGGAITEK